MGRAKPNSQKGATTLRGDGGTFNAIRAEPAVMVEIRPYRRLGQSMTP